VQKAEVGVLETRLTTLVQATEGRTGARNFSYSVSNNQTELSNHPAPPPDRICQSALQLYSFVDLLPVGSGGRIL